MEKKWTQVKPCYPNYPKWSQVNQSEPKWNQVNLSEAKWTQVNLSDPVWTQGNPSEPDMEFVTDARTLSL